MLLLVANAFSGIENPDREMLPDPWGVIDLRI
jgi:hypothetical protein